MANAIIAGIQSTRVETERESCGNRAGKRMGGTVGDHRKVVQGTDAKTAGMSRKIHVASGRMLRVEVREGCRLVQVCKH